MPTSALDLLDVSDDSEPPQGGTPFGRAEVMPPIVLRQRDRRQAFGDLLSGVTRLLDRRNDISLMRGAFEQLLRAVVPARTVQLREIGSRWANRVEGAGAESFTIEVPGD